MFGLGGATSGHAWRDDELVERHRRIDVNAMARNGALIEGAVTTWRWPDGEKATVRASHGRIILIGDRVQVIRFGLIPLTLIHGGARARLICRCGAGAYFLYDDKHGAFACRRCCGYEYRCRHRMRYRRSLKEKIDG
ncbi:hypothetical protein [Bradyrhizobium sp. 27S5]|uniref:hypothetical protein n=1 Tax=Bradyrhizobium sp. 27S5 TaxID=3139728 RepID=UPI0030D0CBE4